MNPVSVPLAVRLLAALFLVGLAPAEAAPSGVDFKLSTTTVACFDHVEVQVNVGSPDATNPFTDVQVDGWFARDGGERVRVEGFCDDGDGRVFRIRFMPQQPGRHAYGVRYKQGAFERTHQGSFTASDAKRRGMVRVDPDHPWHFQWQGTGEHYFWNSTTTYWLLGWEDAVIRASIDRLQRLQVNRLRVAINGRVKNGRAWFENVFPTDQFSFLMNPWMAERPQDVERPGFDVTRFNVAHWQKIERMLRHARELDMVISIIFYVDGARPGVDPFGKRGMGGADEQRYYRYAIARLAPFSNVMWDVTNEYHLFRNEAWANQMGAFVKECDPYDHLTSVHGHGQFPFRKSAWADFAMFQQWDESGGYAFMLRNREEQARTGRPMPQVNEEYGYEDHYPTWGGNRKAPARSADNRRRLAWGMYLAGGYQTTGERADQGTGWGPDTGGGWLNGRGDDAMIMLPGYGHILQFFKRVPWWTLSPDPRLARLQTDPVVKTARTRLVYSRAADGQAALSVDGKPVVTDQVPGDFGNWQEHFRLLLGNEQTSDRPWRGTIHRVVRLRTTSTSPNGEPAVTTPGAESPTRYVAALRAEDGSRAVVYFSAGGTADIDTGRLREGIGGRWFNPRSGRWLEAPVAVAARIAAPDGADWVLLLE